LYISLHIVCTFSEMYKSAWLNLVQFHRIDWCFSSCSDRNRAEQSVHPVRSELHEIVCIIQSVLHISRCLISLNLDRSIQPGTAAHHEWKRKLPHAPSYLAQDYCAIFQLFIRQLFRSKPPCCACPRVQNYI
jgi:hypothetical protein